MRVRYGIALPFREVPRRRRPFCKSRDTDTPAKKITSHTYWRRRVCGETWNAASIERRNLFRR